jgi:hypothetical protein
MSDLEQEKTDKDREDAAEAYMVPFIQTTLDGMSFWGRTSAVRRANALSRSVGLRDGYEQGDGLIRQALSEGVAGYVSGLLDDIYQWNGEKVIAVFLSGRKERAWAEWNTAVLDVLVAQGRIRPYR